MIKIITVDNVNSALSEGLWWLKTAGVEEDSRNGKVLVAPGPVITEYSRPFERVLFSPERDANPFFHLMEALWMLYGSDEVDWPAYFAKRMFDYADEGVLHGAYGYRWRYALGPDQLWLIARELAENPNSRRAVLQMWSVSLDLRKEYKDLPCNTHAYFDLRGGVLNMTVCCRSNDALWGAYGANAVHFSVLQEYLAAWLKKPIGVYRQFSNNFHIYTDVLPLEQFTSLANSAIEYNRYRYYREQDKFTLPLVSVSIDEWNEDLVRFMTDPAGDTLYNDDFFNFVAAPMYTAWERWLARDKESAVAAAEAILAKDWRIACVSWLERRKWHAGKTA